MPVTQGQREFGRLEEVIPQPDRIHVVRLITRRSSDGNFVSIPIDWASNVVDGQVLLTVDRDELDHLPDYVPPIPSAEARDRVQRALQEHTRPRRRRAFKCTMGRLDRAPRQGS